MSRPQVVRCNNCGYINEAVVEEYYDKRHKENRTRVVPEKGCNQCLRTFEAGVTCSNCQYLITRMVNQCPCCNQNLTHAVKEALHRKMAADSGTVVVHSN